MDWNKEKLEKNEWDFCRLWSEHRLIAGCANVLINPKLGDDYFFNRAEIGDCVDAGSKLTQIANAFYEKGMSCYIYDNRSVLDNSGLFHLDTIYTLAGGENGPSSPPLNLRIERADPAIWSDIFCQSFQVQDWRDEVSKITSGTNFGATLLQAVDQEFGPVGCCALYEKEGMTGIYCLGTIPAKRHKGVASSLLKNIAGEQVNPFLQSLESEHSLGFYKKLGFTQIYQKKIYRI